MVVTMAVLIRVLLLGGGDGTSYVCYHCFQNSEKN
jgi:hypothetical protein